MEPFTSRSSDGARGTARIIVARICDFSRYQVSRVTTNVRKICIKNEHRSRKYNTYFDTENLISEVESRIAIWDMTGEEYETREWMKRCSEELVNMFL